MNKVSFTLTTVAFMLLSVSGIKGYKLYSEVNSLESQNTREHLVPKHLNETPNPFYYRNDLIIALDSSRDIAPGDYELAKSQFVNFLAMAWLGYEEARLEFLIYSDYADTVFALNNQLNEFEIEMKILEAPQLCGSRAGDLGLHRAFEDFQEYNRNCTKSTVVFITVGPSNNPSKIKERAQILHQAGVRVFAVGIANAPRKELEDIASDPEFVFGTENFAELKRLLIPPREICNE